MCLINMPGIFHDSTMADCSIYHKIESVFSTTGGKVLVDSAFKFSEQEFFIISSKNDPENAEKLSVNRDAILVR